jgi:hypothetical protein
MAAVRMKRAQELAILTSAHSQQVPIIDISTSLSGVPPCTFKRHFSPRAFRFVCVLVGLLFLGF